MVTQSAACQRMSWAQSASIGLIATLLTACGTTSKLQAPSEQATAAMVDLTPYSRLMVEDFTDEATAKAEVQPLLKQKLEQAIKTFPDQIASVTRAGGGFDDVVRSGTPDASTLILRGAITQLGTWIVDKNSWALGGGFAAAQRPEDFMQEAARKIGTELSTKRKQGAVKAPAR